MAPPSGDASRRAVEGVRMIEAQANKFGLFA
jgi:hypothetical protein